MRISRQVPKLNELVIKCIDDIVSNGVRLGQSLHHIYIANPELKQLCSERTIRRLCYNLHLSIKPHELKKYVVYKREYANKRPKEIIKLRNQAKIVGRTFTDFLKYCYKHKKAVIVQFDSVIGCKNDKKALLTITFKETNFQFGYLIKKGSAQNVVSVIRNLFKKFTNEEVKKGFEVCLSDNGTEFDNFYEIEEDKDTKQHLVNVFFTRTYRSTDKAECERCHEFIRDFIPKGKSMDVYTQDQIDYMFNNINSYVRESKNDLTPYEALCKKLGKEFVEKLPVQKINKRSVKMSF